MRYVVALLIVGTLLLGFRVLVRRRTARGPGVAPARWPWLILVAALLLVGAVGFGLREAAL